MCRDKHVADFMDCLEAWCTRLMGEKPYHIHRFNLSGNDLSDSAVKKIIETLMTLEIRVDVLDLTKNKIQSDAASKIADYVWSTEPLSELLLDRNLLGFEDVNSVLRACYNHSGYPIRKSYGLPIPLKLGITNNPIVAENRVGELLNTIRKQGGKERVWFCNCEEDLSEKELERHREKLETCYLAVHMPGAFTGTDDRTAVRRSRSRTRTRKRQRKEATSDDEEDEEEEQEVSEQRPARQGRRNAERDKRS
ncbi:unnamed protein product [Amoebophrya sp. A120]|nr:unnamed protein product [Amoebophrya sp. A120]|eukprot:GSA120T00002930001.1